MAWLLTRTFIAWLAAALGAAAGYRIGLLLGEPGWGTAVGVALGVLAGLLIDARRGHRLMSWLRGAQSDAAPRDTGFWGELGYRIERALRAREAAERLEHERLQQFLTAIEAAPIGVLLIDAAGQIDWCSTRAAEHFGLDPQRDRRQRLTNLVRAPAFVAYLQEARFEEPLQLAAPGGAGTLSVLVRPYGEGLRLVLSQDVTERERADAMRRDFVANVSHEIRTPLTVLAGFVETMASLPLSPAERERVLVLMQQQAQRMQALVADLLTLAQLEGSPRPAADHWLTLAPLLARALADAAALSAGRHTIGSDLDAAVQLAGSDAELLSAVGNLLHNAVRYTPEGGHIVLRWIGREAGGGAIEVRDTGIGVAREHLPRLTERFYRVDGSRSRDTGGTGLGLSIVKHVVQRHGGEIEVASEPGRGSTFRLVFPALRVRRIVPAPEHAVPGEVPVTVRPGA